MQTSALAVVAMLTAAALAGCSSSGESATESSSPPEDFREAQPLLELNDAAFMCTTAIDTDVFLAPEGISMKEAFWEHYSADLFNVQIIDGEWWFEFLPTHELMPKATCHTNGTNVVPMTRGEFELAMRDYPPYDIYDEVVINQ